MLEKNNIDEVYNNVEELIRENKIDAILILVSTTEIFKITKKIINFYLRNGSNLKDIYIVIGPCISQRNYEVKNDFKKKFVKQNSNNKKYFKSKANKIFFSLKDYIVGQLTEFGIKNIEIIKKDTFNVKNNFFSARRSLKNKNNDYGRNISIIMIR